MDPNTPSILDHYKSKEPLTAGRIGSLTDEESDKLQQLWRLLIAEFDKPDSDPFPVLYSLADDALAHGGDISSLSFEPLVALSSQDRAQSEPAMKLQESPPGTPFTPGKGGGGGDRREELRGASRRNAAKPSTPVLGRGGGWFGWLSSGQSTPTSNQAPTEQQQAEADVEKEVVESLEQQQRRHESVQDYVQRTQSQRDAEELVPAAFTPLFGEPPKSRTFRSAFWQAATQIGDPDSWVLRFLRARKWDVADAFSMLWKTLQWRSGQAIDEITYYGESQLHKHTLETGLAFACTRDRLGNPVYVVRVRANVARDRNIQAIKRFLCWQIETSQLLATGSADGRVTMVFDMTDFTRENIDLKLVRTLITLLTNYYPETLGILMLYVNSLLFSGLWTLISPFIDPVVRSKIVMTKNARDLAPFIDASELVTELGGKKEFAYEYRVPTADENVCMRDAAGRAVAEDAFVRAVDAYEQATRTWLEGGEEGQGAARVGMSGQKQGPGGRDAARESLRNATVALDPYVRARTLYHRFGFIKPDHSVLF
ncbi:phosphatidylinositol transfer protein csr1 [Coemansia sp. RSA 2618]|nr:phosphatidylinositol transfer protein csr1 [Coemansia sp. RSA 2618]